MAGAARRSISKITLVACYLAIYFIWGSTYLAISVSIRTAPIFLASGIRFACAGGALILMAGFRGAGRPTAGNAAIAIQSGAMAFFVSYGVLSWAEKILPSSTAALIISLEPAWFVTFDWLFFSGPKPGRRIISAQAAGIAGVVFLVLGEGSAAGESGRSVAEYAFAATAVALSGSSWVFGALLASKSPRSHGDSAMAAGLQMFCGGLMFMAASACAGDFPLVAAVSMESWLAILYLTVFGSILAYLAYVVLLRSQPASHVSTHSFVNPIVAVALGWAFAGEAVTIYTAIASALIVASVAVIIKGH